MGNASGPGLSRQSTCPPVDYYLGLLSWLVLGTAMHRLSGELNPLGPLSRGDIWPLDDACRVWSRACIQIR